MGLTKTVYNPAAITAAQNSSEEALKKKLVRREENVTSFHPQKQMHCLNINLPHSQEALKLQQDVKKKKQEILEKNIETQKVIQSAIENPGLTNQLRMHNLSVMHICLDHKAASVANLSDLVLFKFYFYLSVVDSDQVVQ